jgi:CRISPR-associated protein Cas2
MFVSIAVDPGSEGRAKELAELLIQYGFEKVQRGLWESAFVSPTTLARLKRDLDRSTDAFDRLRLFQFPVDGTLVLSTLRDKKWRRLVARGGEVPVQQVRPVQPVQTIQVVPARRTVARPVRPYRR